MVFRLLWFQCNKLENRYKKKLANNRRLEKFCNMQFEIGSCVSGLHIAYLIYQILEFSLLPKKKHNKTFKTQKWFCSPIVHRFWQQTKTNNNIIDTCNQHRVCLLSSTECAVCSMELIWQPFRQTLQCEIWDAIHYCIILFHFMFGTLRFFIDVFHLHMCNVQYQPNDDFL